jgi:hypothetical protein
MEARESIAGGIGLPIAILAFVLAVIPPIAFYISWAPGIVALALGIIGVVRSEPSGSRRLAIWATAIAGASFLVTAGWFALGGLVHTFVECFGPSCR